MLGRGLAFRLHECARPLNLIGFIAASSFDVHAHSVNALTEELDHIRFSVRRAPDLIEIEPEGYS
jgi:hypothetical protein